MSPSLDLIFMKACLLSVFLLFALSLQAQTNRALLVTIGNYPEDSGWEEIHAGNDAHTVLSLLLACHYPMSNIAQLADARATKKAIVHALHTLCHSTQAGDCVYLHFSCHGQQMMDDNGDEEDGLDESLIAYDARFWYQPGVYEGANHLRDDELGEWIEKIRRKATGEGRVTVVLDACHSGTGNRDKEAQDYIRGTAAIFAPEGYIPKEGKHPELSLRLKQEKGLATVVVFSACRSDEINYEYFDRVHSRYNGLLTYAFQKTVKETNHTLSVDLFTKQLKRSMVALTAYRKNRKQTPYMECSDGQAIFRIGHEKK